MKKIIYIFLVFLILNNWDCIGQKNYSKSIYVILDNRSKNVKINCFPRRKENMEISTIIGFELQPKISDRNLDVSFDYWGKDFPDIFIHEKVKIPFSLICKLDVVEEKEILKSTEWYYSPRLKYKNVKYYLIDIATLENDSVIMYEVDAAIRGDEVM